MSRNKGTDKAASKGFIPGNYLKVLNKSKDNKIIGFGYLEITNLAHSSIQQT